MKFRASLFPFLRRACAVSFFLIVPAMAQDATLESLVDGSKVAMKEKNWEQALDFNTRAITEFGSGAPLREYGPQFGIIYYHKGFCEMKLKRWKEAMLSFETCYRDFPNRGAAGGNTYQKMALRKWAESAMGAEQWELALAQFRKFIKERDKEHDTFPQGSFYTNLAICHYKLGQIAEGSENLEIAIRNKTNFPTSDAVIITGFQSLVSAVIETRDEQALLDFIGKNRGALMIEPCEMYHFSQVFMKLAGDAVGNGMTRAALEIYQFVPSTDVAIDDVRARLKEMGTAELLEDGGVTISRKKLEEDLATFEADRRGKRATEMIKLAAIAYLHEANGNFMGAYAAYQQLELYFPGAEKRDENLFNLIRVASRVGLGAELRGHAEIYLRDFSESSRIAEVNGFILSSLDQDSDSQRCVDGAAAMLGKLATGTPEHELCLFLLGVSYYKLGEFDKAMEMLDLHQESYPQAGRAAEAAFYQASAAGRLGQWEKAGVLLDGFIMTHPESAFSARALYERAACHFSATEPGAALGMIQRLVTSYPDHPVIARAYILLGQLERLLARPGEAEKSFGKALAIASGHEDRPVMDEALCELVELLGRNDGPTGLAKRAKDVVALAERFWKEHAKNSIYQTRVAVAQVRAFVKVGRGKEALERLREIISKDVPEPGAIGGLIDSYAEAFLESHSAEELARQFEDFPGIDPANRGLLARLRMAVILAYEKQSREAEDEARKAESGAMVKSLYQNLKADFVATELDSPTLIRLGDHLRLSTSTPGEALACYDEVIRRDDGSLRMIALLGRADVRVRSATAGDIDLGIADFKRVDEETRDGRERGYAMFRVIESLMAKGDFNGAVSEATVYLKDDRTGNPDLIPKVRLMLARADQELGRNDEAIGEYAGIWSDRMEDLVISGPAMMGWMQLLWTRNLVPGDPGTMSDRQKAYEGGHSYLEKTRHLVTPQNGGDLAPWHEIEEAVKTFSTSPGIKPVVTNSEPPSGEEITQ
jgi:tetratricopeptide (TPR) repeat protein